MKLIKKIIISIFPVWVAFFVLFPSNAVSYTLTAAEIYNQARNQNHNFMRWVNQYSRAIDLQNRLGDTAYCMALKYNDTETQRFLASYGANQHHQCVQRFQTEIKAEKSQTSYNKVRHANSASVAAADTNYLWWGLGALAVGGGVAIAASSGGGSSNGSGGNNNGGDNTPPADGGNTPPSDGGNTSPGDGSGEEGHHELTDLSPAYFKTDEYNKGNFLDVIHAAEAYSIMYKANEKGELVSHQVVSDEGLRKVGVGVIDTGVYAHRELGNDLAGYYDANAYNSLGNVWGYTKGDLHYYVLYINNLYYLTIVNQKYTTPTLTPFSDLTLDKLNTRLSQLGLSFDDFTLMNGSGGGAPGVSENSFAPGTAKASTWWSIANNLSHGTNIAGIIAADKDDTGMHGVAFENAKVYTASWDYSNKLTAITNDFIEKGVKVFNNSWGYDNGYSAANAESFYSSVYSDTLNAYANVAKNKGVWVQATGNEKQNDAGVQAGIGRLNVSKYGYAGPGQYEVPFVAVTALDSSSGEIASYSNWCGSAAGYCIAAPGSNIYSTAAVENGYIKMSGTSMATPVVSGSIALLMGYYPYLSAQNVAWLLLETANNKGMYADSSIYGRGVLDLEAALTTPAGELSVSSTSDFSSLQPVRSSRLSVGGPVQKGLVKAMPKTITAFDALHRPFQYDTSNMINVTHGSNATFRNKVSHVAMARPRTTIKDEKSGFQFSRAESLNKRGQENLSEVEVVRETDNGTTRFYYAENSQYKSAEDVLKPTENPFFAMKESYGAENSMKLSDVSKLKLSIQTGENGMYDRDYEQDRNSFDERAYAIGAEYSYNMTDYLELAAMGGMLYEEDAMLGLNGRGGFNIKDGSTYYAGIKAALNLTDNITLLAAYYRGYTQGQDSSLLAISNLETESYMIAGEYRLNNTDKVGLSLSSPLSVRRGKSTFNYAQGRDKYTDTIYMNKLTSSLKPAAKEYDLGLYYQGKPKEDLGLMGKVEARFNADGEKGLTDYIGIIGAQYNFPH